MSTQGSVDNVPEFAKLIINEFIKGTKISFVFLMLGTVYSSLLVPLLFSLFAFSTPGTRRQPIFKMVVGIVIFAIGLGIFNGYLETKVLTAPFNMGNIGKKVFAFGVVFSLAPWLIDAVLIMRLIKVYPPRTMSLLTSVAIFTFPFLIKVARMVCFILFFIETYKDLNGTGLLAVMGAGFTMPYTRIEFTLQIFDNAYVSAMFLFKLRGSLGNSGLLGRATDTIASRIRTLFWIAASNFVFPICFNIAQVVVIFTTHETAVPSYLMWTNIYVSILGLVFATVWSNSTNAGSRRMEASDMVSTAYRSNAVPYSYPFTTMPGAVTFPISDVTGSDTIDISGVDKLDVAEKRGLDSADLDQKDRTNDDERRSIIRIDESRMVSRV